MLHRGRRRLGWPIAFLIVPIIPLCSVQVKYADAQCVNPIVAGCGMYKACFSKYCPCKGSSREYFEKYGEKYCEKFLANATLSAQGKKWRDSTFRCLHEAIVPKLDLARPEKCDCASMRDLAFKSHVACYTQQSSSICALPLSDLNETRKTIEIADLFGKEGWSQMTEVARICSTSAPDDGRRTIWHTLLTILSAR